MTSDVERQLRQMVFDHLNKAIEARGDRAFTRQELNSFWVGDRHRRLIDVAKGIWNPRDLLATLAIVSDPTGRRYADQEISDSLLSYDYQQDAVEGDNTKLRRALDLGLPLILFRKIRPSVYMPVFPVYVIADDRPNRRFLIAIDEEIRRFDDPFDLKPDERRYVDRVTKQRLHQPEFRSRVLTAYKNQCAVCSLKRIKLLDAAHITADGHPNGTATVDNGLTLCKIHHAAYDVNYLGISPDYLVHINSDLLNETDGPMLKHGLQEMHRRPLTVPAHRDERPSKERLAERFAAFRAA
ncbi:HNH endonuclease [Nocardia sp. NRRL WC-3656]|uniref:HNH endonuclease n=1 Tax=Nocardia sp. NRRL WC-3656 TaxID=1463824 RepID=UPI0004C331BF|nr:HNH endonuclease [Nocardia sp. NRRL WC-3656]